MGLHDAILIKDNHIAVAGGVAAAVAAARDAAPGLPVEVEARDRGRGRRGALLRRETVLLDNMEPAALRRAVR
jgi:nicotinate-nucleotide pyrophosphorylase (carboxylating)